MILFDVSHRKSEKLIRAGRGASDVLKFRKIIAFQSSRIAMNCQWIYNVLQKQLMILWVR